MKLRIQVADITLRVPPERIQLLVEKGKLTQSTPLPGNQQLNILLEVKEVESISVQYANSLFTFSFPKKLLNEWSEPDKIGYTRNYEEFLLTIEKDLPSRRARR